MSDVMSQINDLKSLPDQALQFELANPSGAVPAYLVLAEAQRRQLLRSAAQSQQSKAPIGSVYDDVIRDMMSRQPPPGPAPAGMTPPPAAPPSQPQNARPPLAMAEGGDVDEDDDDDYSNVSYGGRNPEIPHQDRIVPTPHLYGPTVSATGSANREKYPVTEMPGARFNDLINDAAERYGVDPSDLYGIMRAESSGNPRAHSDAGAVGLMQLLPSTARQYGYGPRDLWNPANNIDAGAHYYRDMLHRFHDPTLARAAYNAGPGAVAKYGDVPPFFETQKYVKRVNQFAQQYKGMQMANLASDDAVRSENPLGDFPADPNHPNMGADAIGAPTSGTSEEDDDDGGIGSLPQPSTAIPKERQGEYKQWLAGLPENLQGGDDDYDMPAAFLAGLKPSEGGHLPDDFKKPNHMTFSDQSKYSDPNDPGGSWDQDKDGSWTFYASPANLRYHSAKELQNYFDKYEPGNKLVLPQSEPPAAGVDVGGPVATPDNVNFVTDASPHIGLPTRQQQIAALQQTPATQDPYSAESLKAKYDILAGLYGRNVPMSPEQQELRDRLNKMYAEADARAHPHGRQLLGQILASLGAGMAQTKGRTWGQALASGAAALPAGMEAEREAGRKEQLEAMGIDLKLDDQMRAAQDKIFTGTTDAAKAQQQAIAQAERNQALAAKDQAETAKTQAADAARSFEDLRKVKGAQYGPSNMFDPSATDYTFTKDPRNPAFGVWSPPAMRKAPKELLPQLNALGGNPITGKPYAVGDLVPFDALEAAKTRTGQVATAAQKHTPTQLEQYATAGIAQTLQAHPDIPQIMNPDGTPKTNLQVSDLPAAVQNETLWRIRIIRSGWTPANIKGLLADPNAPADLVAMAKTARANEAAQAGNITTARTTAAENAKAAAKTALQAKEGAVLNANGSKVMGETDNVGSSIDQLIDLLSQKKYAKDNNPLSIATAWGKYRLGIASDEEDQLGQALSKLSLTSVQGAMPYATKSRNMKWIDMILTHLPNPPFDSPQNMLQKLKTARRGILGIERSALQWDVKNATQNQAAPEITPDRLQTYLRMADGDQKKAVQMAKEDGWGPPAQGQ